MPYLLSCLHVRSDLTQCCSDWLAMPSPHVVRFETAPGYYHVYNRGVEKRLTFIDVQDYNMFLYYLFVYLAPPTLVQVKYPKLRARLLANNRWSSIKLVCYCLMPNHFHFMLQQTELGAITCFMRQLTNAYTKYFNEKYNRVGSLFQGKYKSIIIDSEPYLLELSRYIHRNPTGLTELLTVQDMLYYRWSSCQYFIGSEAPAFLTPQLLTAFFSHEYRQNSYLDFVTNGDLAYLPPDMLLETGDSDLFPATHHQTGRYVPLSGRTWQVLLMVFS